MKKFKIKRTRKPALYHTTRQLFALGDVCTNFLRFFAVYGGGAGKEAYTIARTENVSTDTRLKVERECKLVAENQRLELLNIQLRLELEAAHGKKRVCELLGEPVPAGYDDFDNVPHTI